MENIDKNKPKLNIKKLKPGDILLSYVDEECAADHSLIWTAEEKPLVHCVETEKFSGIFAESGKRLGKGGDEPYMVIRPKDSTLGAKAAKFARGWAVAGGNNSNLKGRLRTPYSQDRLGGGDLDWDDYSYVRAVRAYIRANPEKWQWDDNGLKLPVLSKKQGITCSQLVTYAYQAGAIACALEKNERFFLKSLILQMDQHGWFDELKKRERYQLMIIKLFPYQKILTELISTAFKVDAKTVSVDEMEKRLLRDKTFEYIGNIIS